ncbi:MAG: phosphopantetheine adenylyltransferase [Pseudomonadota bacterium]
MKYIVTTALLIAGIINILPVTGVISAGQLETLYGLSFENNDLVILMRHRAILFGLLGAFMIYAAFRPTLQTLACIAGLISMLAFVVLAYASQPFGEALRKIVIADVIGSLLLLAALIVIQIRQKTQH